MNIVHADLFQVGHLTVEMSRDDLTALDARLPELRQIVGIAGRETTYAESGSWQAFYLGNSAGYVEIVESDTPLPSSFSLSLRSRKKGALDDLRAVLEEQTVAHTLYTERLVEGAESMDWFRCIEIGTGKDRMPLFFNEYCKAFLEDCGVTEETMDLLGRTAPSVWIRSRCESSDPMMRSCRSSIRTGRTKDEPGGDTSFALGMIKDSWWRQHHRRDSPRLSSRPPVSWNGRFAPPADGSSVPSGAPSSCVAATKAGNHDERPPYLL
ncbi:MAG: hypothetical protein MI724_15920 [Spirochaetales bacterium]|nr:hypothetical protein [Spirochaetales bacterium]